MPERTFATIEEVRHTLLREGSMTTMIPASNVWNSSVGSAIAQSTARSVEAGLTKKPSKKKRPAKSK